MDGWLTDGLLMKRWQDGAGFYLALCFEADVCIQSGKAWLLSAMEVLI